MSRFLGATGTSLVGTYHMRRNIASATYAAWTQMSFRDAAWMGACYLLTDELKTAAMARGEVKRVDIRLVAGTEVRIAHQAVPGDNWTSADSNSRVDRSEFTNRDGQWSVWLGSNGGVVTLQIEIHFDIPSADQV